MKIGIVTVPDSANFGSFLQAYALASVLEEWGNEVIFIRTRSKEYLRKLYVNWRPRKSELGHVIQFVKKNLNGREKRNKFAEAQKCFRIYDAFEKLDLDLLLLGSDEIWNVRTNTFQNPLFYGCGIEHAVPVVAYAVSVGMAHYEDFLKHPDIIGYIEQIQDIFVRDKMSRRIVEKITHKTSSIVCDPTFLPDKGILGRDYNNVYLEKHRYLAVYLYPGRISENAVNEIRKYARKNNLKTVSAGFWNEWCDYNIVCSPLEFSSFLEKAEFVITGTFHGTIFSVLNRKPFVSIALSDKVIDLLEQLGLSDRCVDRNELFSDLLEKKLVTHKIDYEKTGEKIKEIKEESLRVLREVVNKYAK